MAARWAQRKLTEEQEREIHRRYWDGREGRGPRLRQSDLAEEYAVSASLIHGVVTYERYSEPAQVIQLPVPQHEFSEEGQVLAERIQETTEMLLSFLKDLYAKVDRLEKDVRGR